MIETQSSPPRVIPRPSFGGLFVPLLLLAVGFLGWTAMQTMQLLLERQALTQTAAQQAAALAAAYKIRVAADSLVPKMQALAEKGNPNAQAVAAELKRRGIVINPGALTVPPP